MSAVTSITLGGLEIGVSPHFACATAMVAAMKSGIPYDPITVDRPGTYPKLVRRQLMPKSIPGQIILLDSTLALRRTWLATLETAALATLEVPLAWTENGTTKTYTVTCSGGVPDEWIHEVTYAMLAVNPVPA